MAPGIDGGFEFRRRRVLHFPLPNRLPFFVQGDDPPVREAFGGLRAIPDGDPVHRPRGAKVHLPPRIIVARGVTDGIFGILAVGIAVVGAGHIAAEIRARLPGLSR